MRSYVGKQFAEQLEHLWIVYVKTRVSAAPEAAILAYFNDCAILCTPEYLHGKIEPALTLISRSVEKMAVVCVRSLRPVWGVFRASLVPNVRCCLYFSTYGCIFEFCLKFCGRFLLKVIFLGGLQFRHHMFGTDFCSKL